MNPFNNLKESVRRYLIKNHLKPSDIKESVPVFEGGHFYLKVTFNNGHKCNFRFFPYKLNKSGAIFLGTTVVALGATSIMGIYGAYKFNNKNDDITLNKIDEAQIIASMDEESNEQVINTEPNVTFEYVDTNDLDPYKMVESSETYNINNSNYRDVNVTGSNFPNIISYNYIMDKYYNQIDKYGKRYGVDPALIASLIMVECGNSKYDEQYQTNASKLGLGQVNCKLFENQVFKTYNYETNTYEDYKFKTSNLMNNRDEQIKFVAISLQYYAKRFNGNINAMCVSYNQGMGTVNNILGKVVSETDYETKSNVLLSNNPALISQYNTYKYGDPEYFNKVMTYLNYCLDEKVFGKDYAEIKQDEDHVYTYGVNTEYKIGNQVR